MWGGPFRVRARVGPESGLRGGLRRDPLAVGACGRDGGGIEAGVGALSRAATGWVSDKFGGGRVTFYVFIGMIISVWGVLQFLPSAADADGNFWGFFACFMALFFLTGVGNASTFQMIPSIMKKELPRLLKGADAASIQKAIERESAAIIAFTSAIAAYGAFFIPKFYGTSISMTGAPNAALWGFLWFYVICVVITWIFYSRKNAPVSC